MIEKARLIPIDRRIHHDLIIDRKQKRVMTSARDVRVPCLGLRRCDPLARILDQSHASRNVTRGEASQALDGGPTDFKGEWLEYQGHK